MIAKLTPSTKISAALQAGAKAVHLAVHPIEACPGASAPLPPAGPAGPAAAPPPPAARRAGGTAAA
eukprot:CAMPEP_0194693324 /NCGR_PEP_ID=MMETSP0295-20121207/20457_1 /TAXON_ID=39354 /ORGANISM="Heterosigma akashiwo, Strain CCMP2393" /LENGTH=65 /DNA_ID=CAMNT_0039584171 /DNA_START=157 /DNA_END=351 /DNA_ORIENTATION=+